MKLYYAPGACSLSDHIALEEAGLPYDRERVDLRSKRTESGADYRAINPKGYVPALALDDGQVLTENVAILPYIGDQTTGGFMPQGLDRYRVIEMLAFTSSELHNGFKPFFVGGSDEEKATARHRLGVRFGQVADAMGGRDFVVGDSFSPADCYMFVVLSWAAKQDVPLPDTLVRYHERLKERPSVRRALADEGLA